MTRIAVTVTGSVGDRQVCATVRCDTCREPYRVAVANGQTAILEHECEAKR